jgi:hypothetical protein
VNALSKAIGKVSWECDLGEQLPAILQHMVKGAIKSGKENCAGSIQGHNAEENEDDSEKEIEADRFALERDAIPDFDESDYGN